MPFPFKKRERLILVNFGGLGLEGLFAMAIPVFGAFEVIFWTSPGTLQPKILANRNCDRGNLLQAPESIQSGSKVTEK